MKQTHSFFGAVAAVGLAVLLAFLVGDAQAVTSPYVTVQQNVPLNQSTTDSVNGIVPFGSHTPIEGSLVSLTDATSPNSPTANVILGPDNTWVGVTWDFGAPAPGTVWRLDRVDIWIAGEDNLRKGFRGDLSVSLTGDVNDFTVIPNSFHEAALSQHANYNYLRYDFPEEFIAGANPDQDRYPVTDFQFLRLNSRGDTITGTDWQSRYVEIDIWVTQIPEPGTTALLLGGLALLGGWFGRRNRR
jgi:hypothetical protein